MGKMYAWIVWAKSEYNLAMYEEVATKGPIFKMSNF